MDNEQNSISQGAVVGILALTICFIILVSYISNLFGFLKSEFAGSHKSDGNQQDSESNSETNDIEKPLVATKSQKSHSDGRTRDVGKGKYTHSWLVASLKAHTGNISDINFSPNGKYLASCANDRTIYLWFVKDYLNNGSRYARLNIDFDHATKICFSPDNRAFLVTLFSQATIRVYKIAKKEDGSFNKIEPGFDFTEKDTEEVLSIGIASNGKFVMTCYKNTIIKIWECKGALLDTINSHQVNHTHGALSPCGRFVACSGFTPEVKVWEVCFTKTGEFKEVTKAFQLGGHKSSTYSFAFNNDSTRMATVSKDGTWKLWDTSIDYKNKQDPKLIHTWSCSYLSGPSLIALSSNGLSAAIANGGSVYMYNVHKPECAKMHDVHPGGVSALQFTPNDLQLAVAGQRSIYLFHNVQGYYALIDDLSLKLKNASNNSMRERLQEQITSTRNILKKFKPIEDA